MPGISIPIRFGPRALYFGIGAHRAVALLLILVAVAALLAVLPGAPDAVRLAGVSLAWWYAGLVAPVLAVAAAIAGRRP